MFASVTPEALSEGTLAFRAIAGLVFEPETLSVPDRLPLRSTPDAAASGASAKLANNTTISGAAFTYTYYTNNTCTTKTGTTAATGGATAAGGAPKTAGTWYVTATLTGTDNYNTSTSGCVTYTMNAATPTISLTAKTATWSGSVIAANTATVTLQNSETYSGTITYTYYTDDACTNKTTVSGNGAAGEGAAPVYSGIYYVKAVAAPDDVFSEIVSNTAKLEIKTNDKENKDKTTQNTDDVTDKKVEEGVSVTDDKTSGEYQVVSATGESGTVVYSGPADRKVKKAVIPDAITIDGKIFQVSGIADNAFKGCTGLKTVKISAGIESIGKNAFKGCKKLTTVKIGSGMKIIGESAFEGCKALKSITIEKNVTKIGKKAFYKCKNLKKINFKTEKLQSVGSKAFKKIGSNCKVTFKKKYRKKYMKLTKGKIG
mgnify:CR=1 FL=1